MYTGNRQCKEGSIKNKKRKENGEKRNEGEWNEGGDCQGE